MSQLSYIRKAVNELLDSGMTDKKQIYNLIEKNLNLPRPTIRRVCNELAKEMARKADILKPISEVSKIAS